MEKVSKTIIFPVEIANKLEEIAISQRRSFSSLVVIATETLINEQPEDKK